MTPSRPLNTHPKNRHLQQRERFQRGVSITSSHNREQFGRRVAFRWKCLVMQGLERVVEAESVSPRVSVVSR